MDKFLDTLYKETATVGMFASQNLKKYDKKDGSFTYGEISRRGVEKFIEVLSPKFLNETSVFYDIGSGTGKMVLHIAEKVGCEATGIEVVEERHIIASNKKIAYENDYPNISKAMFINDKFQNVPIADATVIYCDNTLHNLKFMQDIVKAVQPGCIIASVKHIQGVEYTPIEGIRTVGVRIVDGVKPWSYKFKAPHGWSYRQTGYIYLYQVKEDDLK